MIFLRKLVEGGSKHSFGIHVAKMAGMPKEIVQRAGAILGQLEAKAVTLSENETPSIENPSLMVERVAVQQLGFFNSEPAINSEIVDQLEIVDINSMTPIECMMKLHELKGMLDAAE